METDTQKIRVLLADDSQIALNIINNILSADPRIEVIGQASNGVEALSMVHDLKPDILCTDYHMPKMDGLELTRRLMSESPLPILVISISVQDTPDDKDNIFRLIEAGAVDVMPKPEAVSRPILLKQTSFVKRSDLLPASGSSVVSMVSAHRCQNNMLL